jgi:hypothetical protein
MYVKVTTSGPRRYSQLIESFRDDDGRVKKRTVATLGRTDQLSGELDSVIAGLLKVAGREPAKLVPAISASSLSFDSARALGNVWTLTEIWKELGFSDLRRVFRRTRHTIDVEALIRIMVLNRLCDPDSKLGVLRWLQTVALPDVEIKAVTCASSSAADRRACGGVGLRQLGVLANPPWRPYGVVWRQRTECRASP